MARFRSQLLNLLALGILLVLPSCSETQQPPEEIVRSIKTIIRSNRLTQLDKARLGDNVSTNPFFPDA